MSNSIESRPWGAPWIRRKGRLHDKSVLALRRSFPGPVNRMQVTCVYLVFETIPKSQAKDPRSTVESSSEKRLTAIRRIMKAVREELERRQTEKRCARDQVKEGKMEEGPAV